MLFLRMARVSAEIRGTASLRVSRCCCVQSRCDLLHSGRGAHMLGVCRALANAVKLSSSRTC